MGRPQWRQLPRWASKAWLRIRWSLGNAPPLDRPAFRKHEAFLSGGKRITQRGRGIRKIYRGYSVWLSLEIPAASV